MSNVRLMTLLGYNVVAAPRNAFCEALTNWISSADRCKWAACINPHSYAVAQARHDFDRALRQADWLVPDGVGIVLASRILGISIPERVTGSDIFEQVSTELNRQGARSVFFLGATPDVLARIRDRMAEAYPRIRVAGTYSPPFCERFSSQDLEAMIAAVNSAAPDVLWVGLTAPKQELFLAAAAGRLNVRFAAAIGAVFDFFAGTVTRSHPVFQWAGLEWLPRLLRQPRRLWKRTLISGPLFLLHTVRALLASRQRAGVQK